MMKENVQKVKRSLQNLIFMKISQKKMVIDQSV